VEDEIDGQEETYGGLMGDQVNRLKELDTENSRLRRADLAS